MSSYGLATELQAIQQARERHCADIAGGLRSTLEVARTNITDFLRIMKEHEIPSSYLQVSRRRQVKKQRHQQGPKRYEEIFYVPTQYRGWCLVDEQYEGDYILALEDQAVVLTTEGPLFGCTLRYNQKTGARDLLVVTEGQVSTPLEEWPHAIHALADTQYMACLTDRYIQGVSTPWQDGTQ